MKNSNENKKHNLFLKFQKFHDYFTSKHTNENKEINKQENQENIINEEKNIYIKYLDKHDIIFQKNDPNNENLKLLFKQIGNDIENKINILFPFLNISSNLVKAYIESDLDNNILQEKSFSKEANFSIEKKEDSLYLQVLKKLKYNCFIHKDIIIFIYEYFSNLYDKVQTIKADNPLIKKFYKMMSLFKIYYEKGKNNNKSSICSLGGNFKIVFNKKVNLSQCRIIVNINILDYYFEDINIKNFSYIKINSFEEKYGSLLNNIQNTKLQSINFIINTKSLYLEIKTEKKSFTISKEIKNLSEIEEINILEEFYGQISSVEISIEENSQKIQYIFQPISIRNKKDIFFYEKIIKGEKFNLVDNIIPKIEIINNNLVKVNYLNYNDNNFDIIDYFGGVIQFLPFYHIFRSMEGENWNKINGDVDKMKETINNENISLSKSIETSNKKLEIYKQYINSFANFLVKIIIEKLYSSPNKIKLFKKYYAFIFYLLLKSNLELEFLEDSKNNKRKNTSLQDYIGILIMFYYNQKNLFSFNAKTELDNFKNEMIKNNEKIDLKVFKNPNKSFNQLYNHFMKQLFVFNNLWSQRNNFFNNGKNKNEKLKEIKYKQINYYTKNFQLPFFYPILEIKKYYPQFSQLKDGIFLGEDKNVLDYEFDLNVIENCKKDELDLDENENNHKKGQNKKEEKEKEKKVNDILEAIIYKEKENNDISEKCCLVKNTHHVIGKLLIKKKDIKKKKIKLIFEPIQSDESNKSHISNLCNKNDNLIDQNKKNKIEETRKTLRSNKIYSLCYGASFPCPLKEFIRKIIIKQKDIMFLLFRVYYYRVSGLEIFTINKSYYFNFKNFYDINGLKKNKIINEFKLNPSFKEIKLKKDKIILGFYNIIYEPYLFPLFRDEINNWDKKVKYLCNYDIIILINLFSNRSFRDVYQYPVFPTLFDWINLKRNMGEHIALQDISNESIIRRDIIINMYEGEVGETDEESEEKFLFNIHYSNPAFIFNYLLRVLPYSFLAVEFQGEDFDNANRLFYSIDKALKSILSLKSDLREMIPELFYMPEMFYNKNRLLFDNLYDGTNIDNVEIIEEIDENNKEGESQKLKNKITQMQDITKFLYKMRMSLENLKDLNNWIDLIFGAKQKYYKKDNKKYPYYEKYSEISFKNDLKLLNNSFIMDLADFGLLPLQLFNKDFPSNEVNNKIKIIPDLQKLNKTLFNEEHITEINSPIDCFICKGSTIINNNYIKKIDPKEQINIFEYFDFPYKYIQKFDINNLKDNNLLQDPFSYLDIKNTKKTSITEIFFYNYYFIGDLYGGIFIYSLEKAKENEEEEEEQDEMFELFGSFEIINDEDKDNLIKEISYKSKNQKKIYHNVKEKRNLIIPIINDKLNFKFNLKLIQTFYNHTKEIKYIDFNPRLNIFLSYSLDQFINIYIFPKFKLINVIDTSQFKESNFFDEVVLISNPFPMIICHNKDSIYLLSINGEIIKKELLEENHKISFSIDKNLGLSEDLVILEDSTGIHNFNYI